VPRQYSTGGKQKLYGISKRGNIYLRRMLIHGARAEPTGARIRWLSNSVNEFYQKGCQEKSSASTGDEMFSRDPAHGN
jgi:hypothetical protein